MIACGSPCCIEEIFELVMEYFKLLNKCFAIFSRVLGYSCKHEFCSNQIFRASIPVKLVLYSMLDFLLKFSTQSVHKETLFTTNECPTVFVYGCNTVTGCTKRTNYRVSINISSTRSSTKCNLKIMRDVSPVRNIPNSCQRNRCSKFRLEGWQTWMNLADDNYFLHDIKKKKKNTSKKENNPMFLFTFEHGEFPGNIRNQKHN